MMWRWCSVWEPCDRGVEWAGVAQDFGVVDLPVRRVGDVYQAFRLGVSGLELARQTCVYRSGTRVDRFRDSMWTDFKQLLLSSAEGCSGCFVSLTWSACPVLPTEMSALPVGSSEVTSDATGLLVVACAGAGIVRTYSSRKPPRHRNNSSNHLLERPCPSGWCIDSTCINTIATRVDSNPVENPEQHPPRRHLHPRLVRRRLGPLRPAAGSRLPLPTAGRHRASPLPGAVSASSRLTWGRDAVSAA